MPASLISQAIDTWPALDLDHAAESEQHDYTPDPVVAAADRFIDADPRPPEIASLPALTAAIDAEFAACRKWLDLLRTEALILRRPRPCGHPAHEEMDPPLDCVFCVLLTYTVRVSQDLRRHALQAAGDWFLPHDMLHFDSTDERHAYAEAYHRWLNDRETPDDVRRLRANQPESRYPSLALPRIDTYVPKAKPQVTAMEPYGGDSSKSAPSISTPTSKSASAEHAAALVDMAGGTLAKTAAEWGRALNVSGKRAAALLRDADLMRDYGMEVSDYRRGHARVHLWEVRRIEPDPA